MSIQLVIDPGHGGENLGAQYYNYTEKNLTVQVGLAMAEELRKYDGIDVYLTREEDLDVSLADRCQYADDVDADFFISLHFNASEEHTLYGKETWVSAFGECYAQGYSFGKVWLDEMSDTTLHNRGVKTRLNDDGIDYYGVIRRCTEYQIPSCIIEHCYMDIEEEHVYFNTSEALKQLGIKDATAVAKFFGLSSEELGVDYSDYAIETVPVPTSVMAPDMTEPTLAEISELSIDEDIPAIHIDIRGEDEESGLLYYSYSTDGGMTYSTLQRWPAGENETDATIALEYDKNISLICRVYNGYDLYTETNVIEIGTIHSAKSENIEENRKKNMEENTMATTSEDVISLVENEPLQDAAQQKTDSGDIEIFLFLVFAILLVSLGIVFTTLKLMFPKKKHRKH